MFTSIYNSPRFFNPMLSEICKKSTNEYIRRITEKYKEKKDKIHDNSNLVSSMVLNANDKNNNTPNPIFPIFSFITIAYFSYTFFKSIK